VIKSDVIEAQGATTLRDVLRNVSGITFQAGEGGGGLPGDTFTLRGFSAVNDMFVDGIRDTGGYSRDAFNLEQVEVVKGPSSSISGRGSTGGAVNQVTKSPTATGLRHATIGGGSAEYRRGTFDVNQPLGNPGSGAAFRLNGMWTDSDVPGRDVVNNA
jgi:catecholate siderophore receptor